MASSSLGNTESYFQSCRKPLKPGSNIDLMQPKICHPSLHKLVYTFTFLSVSTSEKMLEEKKKLFYHIIKGQVLRSSSLLYFPLPQENLELLSYFFKPNPSFSAPSMPKSCYVFLRQLCAPELLRVSNPGRSSDITLLLVC